MERSFVCHHSLVVKQGEVFLVVAFILAIVAAVKSANGERYQYPYILRLIK